MVADGNWSSSRRAREVRWCHHVAEKLDISWTLGGRRRSFKEQVAIDLSCSIARSQ